MKSTVLPGKSLSPGYAIWPLFGLLVFTLLSGIGYATFGRHPEWLQFIPAPFLSELTQFFGIAFTFFAQGHIWISCGVLFLYLSHRTKLRWIPAFLAVYVLSLSSELAGVRFGIPFGDYTYTELLGTKWFNLVPILIPFSWFSMALPSFALSFYAFPKTNQRFIRIGFAALLLALWDLSLDPAMSYLTTYWTWAEPGPFYGMPWVNLGGWYVTGLVLMTALHLLRTEQWIPKLSLRWVTMYYGLILLLPMLMVIAAGLWFALAVTLGFVIPCAWIVERNYKKQGHDDFSAYGTLGRAADADASTNPDTLHPDGLKAFFSSHSRSFSFAARFFSSDQYQLVTRLYAFCRTTDDIPDTIALRDGSQRAEEELNAWEERVYLSYQGIPSGIEWLDELMNRSNQAGVPFDLIQDLIVGVRTDLRSVEIKTVEELDRYCYCVASVVGIWLCYLFGVRDREILERASAMGRAMQVTNILRDVGEDLQMDRLYLPTELMGAYGVSKNDLQRMASGEVPISEEYQSLLEDLMERAEADYQYAFRGLSAIPPSFARAAAVASEVYKGIHRSLRRNQYDNFKRRAYTRWYEKVFMAMRALRRLKLVQNRPFITTADPVFVSYQQLANNHRRQQPLIVLLLAMLLCFQGAVFAPTTEAQWHPPMPASVHTHTDVPPLKPMKLDDDMDANHILVEQIRSLYFQAVDEADAIQKGFQLIDAHVKAPGQPQEPVLGAYRAALIVLQAKHAFWPQKKLRFLKSGLPQLDGLVAANPENVEIRYLRLMSCYYLPRFLGMSSSTREDVEVLAQLLPEARHKFPTDLFNTMTQFVTDNKELSEEEKKSFQRHLHGTPPTSPHNKAFKTYE